MLKNQRAFIKIDIPGGHCIRLVTFSRDIQDFLSLASPLLAYYLLKPAHLAHSHLLFLSGILYFSAGTLRVNSQAWNSSTN